MPSAQIGPPCNSLRGSFSGVSRLGAAASLNSLRKKFKTVLQGLPPEGGGRRNRGNPQTECSTFGGVPGFARDKFHPALQGSRVFPQTVKPCPPVSRQHFGGVETPPCCFP